MASRSLIVNIYLLFMADPIDFTGRIEEMTLLQGFSVPEHSGPGRQIARRRETSPNDSRNGRFWPKPSIA